MNKMCRRRDRNLDETKTGDRCPQSGRGCPSGHMHSRCALKTPGRSPDSQSSAGFCQLCLLRAFPLSQWLPGCAPGLACNVSDYRCGCSAGIAAFCVKATHLLPVSLRSAERAWKHLLWEWILRWLWHSAAADQRNAAATSASSSTRAIAGRSSRAMASRPPDGLPTRGKPFRAPAPAGRCARFVARPTRRYRLAPAAAKAAPRGSETA